MSRMMHAFCRVAAFAGAIVVSAAPAQAQHCAPFTDVAASSGFCSNIQWLYNRGITQGCSATHYCPAHFVRRDQIAAFLNRLADNLFPLNCAAGQVMKWNGTAWLCAADSSGPADAFVRGGNAFGTTAVLGTNDAQALELEAGNARVMRFEPNAASPNVIGGHPSNSVTVGPQGVGATVAGGGSAGMCPNIQTGGTRPCANHANNYSAIGGGTNNVANGDVSVIAGGYGNTTANGNSTVGGGQYNRALGPYSVVAGGGNNVASGHGSTVVGGQNNQALGTYSVVMGVRALATEAAMGSFVFSDASGAGNFGSGQPNEFLVAATGGIGMWTQKDYDTGCKIPAGSGTWSCSSSKLVKRDFEAVDPAGILAKVVALPITTWSYRQEVEARHVGPTAQDFWSAFGLGRNDGSIAAVDADGVALAAIQGLNAKLEARLAEQGAKLAERDAEVATLRQELAAIRDLLMRRE